MIREGILNRAVKSPAMGSQWSRTASRPGDILTPITSDLPGIPGLISRFPDVLLSPCTVQLHDEYPVLGTRDATASRSTLGPLLPGVLNADLLKVIRGALVAADPSGAAAPEVHLGSLGRLARVLPGLLRTPGGPDVVIPSGLTCIAAELLEVMNSGALAHILLGAQYRPYITRIWNTNPARATLARDQGRRNFQQNSMSRSTRMRG